MAERLTFSVDPEKVNSFYKRLCRSNLRSSKVKACATCPWEPAIVQLHPEARKLFREKRKAIN